MSGAEAGIACVIVTQLLQGRICSSQSSSLCSMSNYSKSIAIQGFANIYEPRGQSVY